MSEFYGRVQAADVNLNSTAIDQKVTVLCFFSLADDLHFQMTRLAWQVTNGAFSGSLSIEWKDFDKFN